MRTVLVIVALAACHGPRGEIREPWLRAELLAMFDEDQAARGALVMRDGMLIGEGDRVGIVDRMDTARMKQIVAVYGWPGTSLVGDDGAHAAWLLVQHADEDVAFQAACLARMQSLLDTGEIAPRDYAYLYDRVALATGTKQRYGTQWGPGLEPFAMEDPQHIDERRASVGLGTLAEGRQEMIDKYGPP